MPDPRDITFTVVIDTDGQVVSVDGQEFKKGEDLSKVTEAVTRIVVPFEIVRVGARYCIHSGCQIFCH